VSFARQCESRDLRWKKLARREGLASGRALLGHDAQRREASPRTPDPQVRSIAKAQEVTRGYAPDLAGSGIERHWAAPSTAPRPYTALISALRTRVPSCAVAEGLSGPSSSASLIAAVPPQTVRPQNRKTPTAIRSPKIWCSDGRESVKGIRFIVSIESTQMEVLGLGTGWRARTPWLVLSGSPLGKPFGWLSDPTELITSFAPSYSDLGRISPQRSASAGAA
jgi:hypothetical protein